MPFSALSSQSRIQVILDLIGGPRYRAAMAANTRETVAFGRATKSAAAATATLSERTFVHNQLLYTTRRLMFYTTLGLVAMGAQAVRMGFQYNSALQTAQVMLRKVLPDQAAIREELGKLYTLAALSPFLFKDTTVAFRKMYLAFKPLGYSVDFTNRTIQMLVDSLTAAGNTTPAAFNRAAVALQHMAFVGRPMGQIILQLARDGLPIYAALNKELGLSGESLKNIANTGVTAQQVIQALNSYVQKTPGYANAAAEISRKTLLGAFRQFQDILSQAMGRSTGGIFTGLTQMMAQVDRYLEPMFKARQPISLLNIAQAFDSALTPSTHAVLNIFVLLQSMIQQIILDFKVMAYVLSLPTRAFGFLTGAGNANIFVMKVLGGVLGVLATAWIVEKSAIVADTVWMEINNIRKYAAILLGKSMVFWKGLELLWRNRNIKALWAEAFALETNAAITNYGRIQVYKYTGMLATFVRFLKLSAIPTIITFTRTMIASAASMGVAEIIAMWPLALVAVFGILYWKVKQFRDIVKETVSYLVHPIHAGGLLGILEGAARTAIGGVPGLGGLTYALGQAGGGPAKSIFSSGPPSRGVASRAVARGASAGGLNLGITVNPQEIKLDSRVIAQVMSTVTTNAEARQ